MGGQKLRKSGGPKCGGPEVWRPEWWEAQNFALLFPSPAPFSLFFFPLGWSSRGIVVADRGHGPPKECVWASLGSFSEAPATQRLEEKLKREDPSESKKGRNLERERKKQRHFGRYGGGEVQLREVLRTKVQWRKVRRRRVLRTETHTTHHTQHTHQTTHTQHTQHTTHAHTQTHCRLDSGKGRRNKFPLPRNIRKKKKNLMWTMLACNLHCVCHRIRQWSDIENQVLTPRTEDEEEIDLELAQLTSTVQKQRNNNKLLAILMLKGTSTRESLIHRASELTKFARLAG